MPFRHQTAFAVAALMPMIVPVGATPPLLQPKPLEIGILQELRWNARPVVVLGAGADAEAQLAALLAAADLLAERDVVLLTDGPGAGELRRRVGPGFAILLIGKDGGVKLARNRPVSVSEITALIDSMPMRQREAAERDR